MTLARERYSSTVKEKTLFDVLSDVWRAKYFILIFVILFTFLALIFLSVSNRFYRAEMIISPAYPMGYGAAQSVEVPEGSMQIQRSELQSNRAFLKFENTYKGVSVAGFLLKDREIINGLKFDRRFEFSEGRQNWTAEELSEYISKRVRIGPVSGTPMRRMTYFHPDKAFAAEMIKRIHRITDEMIRARILVSANQRINYLNTAISTTHNPEHKRNLANLLLEQERLKMMVSLDEAYAASVVEPPAVSSKPKWPDPYMIYPIFILLGVFLGFIIHGLRHHE